MFHSLRLVTLRALVTGVFVAHLTEVGRESRGVVPSTNREYSRFIFFGHTVYKEKCGDASGESQDFSRKSSSRVALWQSFQC
jgi:hypothetical protein